MHFVTSKGVFLTKNGKDNYEKIKDIPRPPEIVPAHPYDLDDGLERKDSREHNVADLQTVAECLGLTIMFHCHGNHVEKYEDDYGQLKLGAHGYVEEKSLDFVLEGKRRISISTADGRYMHPCRHGASFCTVTQTKKLIRYLIIPVNFPVFKNKGLI